MPDADHETERARADASDELNGDQDELVREPLAPSRPPRRWHMPRTLAALRERRGPAARAFAQRRRLLLTAVLLLVVLLAGVVFGLVQHFSPQVVYARVTLGNLTIAVPATGTLQSAVYDTDFSASGTVVEIDVKVGDTVTQGQTLAKLDTTPLKDALNQAQAALAAAQTKFDDANANLNKVQAQTSAQLAYAYDQKQSAIAKCGGNSGCIQQAQDQYAAAQATADNENATAQAAVNEAQSEVSVAQAALQTAQHALDGAVLKAPHAGTVSAIYGSVGSVVGKSDAPFIRIADLNALQVSASVSVANIAGVQKGQDVTLRVPAAGKQTFHGSVTSISPAGQVSGGVLYYPVLVDVDMNSVTSANLLPGMSASATIITAQAIGVALVPASAVRFAAAAGDPKRSGFLSKQQVTSALGKARDQLTALQSQGNLNPQDNPTPAYLLQYTNGKWVTVPVVLGLTDGKTYELLQGPKVGTRIVAGETNSPVVIPTPTPVVTH
jgi:multidrug efflux pump subunit AcrA (membrane-fusion protein)